MAEIKTDTLENVTPGMPTADVLRAIGSRITRGVPPPGKGENEVPPTSERNAGGESPKTPARITAPEPKKPDAATPAGDDEGSDSTNIPYSRFKHVNEERKALAAERDRLAAEVNALRKETKTAKDVETLADVKFPDGFDDMERGKQVAWIAANVVDKLVEQRFGQVMPSIAAMKVQADFSKNLGMNLSMEQADAIRSVSEEMPRLTASEALMIAKARTPDVFEASDSEGAPPPSHMVQNPRGTQKTQPKKQVDPRQEILDSIKNTTASSERDALIRKLIGASISPISR